MTHPHPDTQIPVAVVLDFDGVVLDSARIKTEAFRELFHDRPEYVHEIVDYHMRHGGISRCRKFEYIFDRILHEQLTAEGASDLNSRFVQFVWNDIIRCRIIEGTAEFIAAARQSSTPVFVASGTEEQELRAIVRTRHMDDWFDDIYGSPRPKPEILAGVSETLRCEPSSILFVGDAVSDLEDAIAAGVAFVGLSTEGSSTFPASVCCLETLAGLQPRDVWRLATNAPISPISPTSTS